MRPLSSSFSTMIRSLGGAASQQRKKKKRLVLEAPRTTSNLVVRNNDGKRRRRNRALTESEFYGGILCHLDNNVQSRDCQNSHDSSLQQTRQSPPVQIPKISFSRALLPQFPSSTFLFSRKKSNCMCCRSTQSPPILTSKKPEFPSPSYPRQDQVGDCSSTVCSKRVTFTSDTKPGTPRGVSRKRPIRITSPRAAARQQPTTPTPPPNHHHHHHTEVKRTLVKKRGRTVQRRASLEDLLRSLRKDRRRSHNLALSADDFQKSIIPSLLLSC